MIISKLGLDLFSLYWAKVSDYYERLWLEIYSEGLIGETVLFEYGFERCDGILLEFIDDIFWWIVVKSPVPVIFPFVRGLSVNRLSKVRIIIRIELVVIILWESTFSYDRLYLVFESESRIIIALLLR